MSKLYAIASLKHQSDFLYNYKKGKKDYTLYYNLYLSQWPYLNYPCNTFESESIQRYCFDSKMLLKIGITVSKKLGGGINGVQRNYLRRKSYHAFYQAVDNYFTQQATHSKQPCVLHVVIKPTSHLTTVNFQQLTQFMHTSFCNLTS